MSEPTIMRSTTARAVDAVTVRGLATVRDGSSAIDLAARAGAAALTDAGLDGGAVDVLIHVGVYRDDNIVEPAVAALIQKRMGIGLDYGRGDHRMYSFDLMNGACGVPVAISMGSALLATEASTVLITASDAHPGGDHADRSPDFPYAPVGAAMVLGSGGHGIGPLCGAASSGDGAPVGYALIPEVGAAGRRSITVRPTPPELLQTLVDDVLGRVEMMPDIAAALPDGVTIPGAQRVFRSDADTHTAGPITALLAARAAGADRVTLLAAGGGPEAAAVTVSLGAG